MTDFVAGGSVAPTLVGLKMLPTVYGKENSQRRTQH